MYFNEEDFNDYLKILKIDKYILPLETHYTSNIPGKVGLLLNRSELGSRPIVVEIEVEEDENIEKQYEELSRILYTEEPAKLKFKSDPSKYFLAKVEDVSSIETIRHFGIMRISFLCFYPLAISEETKEIDDIDGKTNVNQGSYPTTGIITVTFDSNADHVRIALVGDGEYLYVEHDFVSGDVLEIDLERETIKKNDLLIMEDLYYESDFFDIPVGNFRINVNNGTGKLSFKERWLY